MKKTLEEIKKDYETKKAEYESIGLKSLSFVVWRTNLGKRINKTMMDDFDIEKTLSDREGLLKLVKETRKKHEKNADVNARFEDDNKTNVEVSIDKECHWLVLDYFDSKTRYYLKYGVNKFDEVVGGLIPFNKDVKIRFKPTLEEIFETQKE